MLYLSISIPYTSDEHKGVKGVGSTLRVARVALIELPTHAAMGLGGKNDAV
jgi:hypothetical protein